MDGVVAEDELAGLSFSSDAIVGWDNGLWDVFACKAGAGVGEAWIEDEGGNFVSKRSVRERITSLEVHLPPP